MLNLVTILKEWFRRQLFAVLKRVGVRKRLGDLNTAVATAIVRNIETKQKCFVFMAGNQFMVLSKQDLRAGKRRGMFPGMTYAEIERKALYATR